MTTQPRYCPACGAVLPENRLAGLCPACTWKGLSDSREEEPASEHAGILMRLPGYEILAEIARGGMGIVYQARQLDPARTVALKMLLPHQLGSTEMADRFRLEVRALTELEHPAILPVYQVGEHDRLPFFTMKLATGGTLAQRKGEFAGNWRAIAELMATLADAVHFAHEHGVLHRDLKPGNVLFDDARRPYVSDFGLAKLVNIESDLTRSLDFLGTPHYVAPEVAARSPKSATTASDIYGLGAILYELLAGRPPFDAEGVPALLRKIADEEPPPPSAIKSGDANPALLASAATTALPDRKVPRDLEVICLKCLAKEPARRYRSAREFADDLRRWSTGRTILARPATNAERLHSWTRRNPALAGMGVALLLVLGAAIALQAQANRRLQQTLMKSLLAQAELQRSSGRAGQRFETLSLIKRATENGWNSESRTALRTEVAAALALPDMRPLGRWPVQISHFENDFDFTGNLDRYAAATPDGGFAIFSTASHQRLWQRPGLTNNPAVELRLSADGRWVAARFQDGLSELHDTFANTPQRRWRSDTRSRPLFAFDPAGENFAMAFRNTNSNHDVEVIRLANKVTHTIVPQSIPMAMTFDQRGALLATASEALSVWRLADTNRLWASPLSHQPSAITWSGDGRHLAVALDRRLSNKGEGALKAHPVLIFDATTGRQKSVFTEVSERVERLAFHPDGQSLVAASWGGKLAWGSVQPDGFRLVTEGMQRALGFAPDGQRLGYAPTKEELGLLEVAQPGVLREWQSESPPGQEAFNMTASGDGRWIVTGTGSEIQLWDASTRTAVASLPLPAKPWWISVLFGPDDHLVYYSAASFGVRRVHLVPTNAPDGTISLRFGPSESVGEPREFIASRFAADGRSLIVGQNRRRSVNERIPPTIWLWPDCDPARARKLVENFPLVGYRELAGGRWAVSTDLIEPDLWVWNIETGKRVRSLGISSPTVSEPAPNGRWLLTRTRAESVVWEAGSWRALARWPVTAPEQGSSRLVVSPDSQLLATATLDGRITLRAMPSGHKLITLSPPRPMPLSDWRFSPNNERLYVLSTTGRVFDWNLAEVRSELAKLRLDW